MGQSELEAVLTNVAATAHKLAALTDIDLDLRYTQLKRTIERTLPVCFNRDSQQSFTILFSNGQSIQLNQIYGMYDIVEQCFLVLGQHLPSPVITDSNEVNVA